MFDEENTLDEFLIDIDEAIRIKTKWAPRFHKLLNKASLDTELTDEQFIKLCISLLTSQSYGSQIPNRFNRLSGTEYRKQLNVDDRGDIVRDGRVYEEKTSILSSTNKSINIRQIRQHQNIDGYIVRVIITNSFPYKLLVFTLSKEEMAEEVRDSGNRNAHLTIAASANNAVTEKMFEVKPGTERWNRWMSQYLVEELTL